MDQQGVQPTGTTPGTLNYVPTKPEGAVESIAPIVEKTAPSTENLPTKEAQENEPLFSVPDDNSKKQQEEPLIKPYTPPAQAKAAAIVDKSNAVTKLHSIQDSPDTLTKTADLEEEEFIEKNEAAHGHK